MNKDKDKDNDKDKDKFIDGPINSIRLEGVVNNIKKIVYLYADIHQDMTHETVCDSVRSKHIKTYLVEQFDKLEKDHIIDFMLELYPTFNLSGSGTTNFKQKYILDLRVMFQKAFNYDRKKDKILISKQFPNIRLHYLDIRDYIQGSTYDLVYNTLQNSMDNLKNSFNEYYVESDIQGIKDGLSIVTSYMDNLYNIIYKNKNKKDKNKNKPVIPATPAALSKYTKAEYTAIAENLVNKLLDKYNHKNVKDVLHEVIVNDVLLKKFDEYFKNVNDLYMYINKETSVLKTYPNKLYQDDTHDANYGLPRDIVEERLLKISNYFDKITLYYMDIAVYIMDIYSLRRMLDKDYINTVISYTGAYHTSNYIYILIKYFDFKITHISHLKLNNITELNDKIKNLKNIRDTDKYIWPDTLFQCSDMNSFPDNFK